MDDDDKPIEPLGLNDGLTREEREDEFLRLLSQGCLVKEAAAAVAIPWRTLYHKRSHDPAFAARWEDAKRVKVDHLIAEAERRAMRGSDRLLMFLLSSYRPEQFKQRATLEHHGGVSLSVVTGLPGDDVDDLL